MHGPDAANGASSVSSSAAQDVVGVEHRILGHLAQPVGAVAQHVGQRARMNMPIWPWKATMRPKALA